MLQLFMKRHRSFMLFVTVVLMMLSLNMPFSSSLSIIYQLVVVGFVLIFGFDTAETLIPLFVLSTVRSYIAVSVQSRDLSAADAMYYGLNGNILAIMMIGICLIYLYKHNGIVKIDFPHLLITFFAGLMLLSKFLVLETGEYTSNFNAICLIYMLVPFFFMTKEDAYAGRFAFVLGGAFLALGIIPHLSSQGTIYEVLVKVDRNYQSCILLMCILEAILFLLCEGKESKWYIKLFCVVVILADMFIIVTSASRSALLALAIAAIVFTIANVKHIRRNLMFILAMAVVVMFAMEVGLLDFVLSRFELSNVSTGNGRFDLWKKYLQGFDEGTILQILFGHGLTGISVVGNAAHNMFISVLYSFGLFGLICLCVAIIAVIVRFIRSGKQIELVSLIPVLFMCLTIEPYYRIEFALFLGKMIGVSRLSKEKVI